MADIRTLLRSELASRGQTSTKTPSKPASKKRKAESSSTSPSHAAEQQQRNKKRNVSSATGSLAEVKARQVREEQREVQQQRTGTPKDTTESEAVGRIVQPQRHGREAGAESTAGTEGDKALAEAPVPTDAPTTVVQTADLDQDTTAPTNDVDEAEWAAFESEIAREEQETDQPPQAPRNPRAVNPHAVIEAKPMSAEELAAQAREEQSVQRGRKEVEAEEEREEAGERLMEEFEEMEGLEERVRRLRERRDRLRGGGVGATTKADAGDMEVDAGKVEGGDRIGREDEESSEEDEDDDDDFELWRRR